MQHDRIFTLIPSTWMDLCLTNQSVTISQQGQELNEVRAIVSFYWPYLLDAACIYIILFYSSLKMNKCIYFQNLDHNSLEARFSSLKTGLTSCVNMKRLLHFVREYFISNEAHQAWASLKASLQGMMARLPVKHVFKKTKESNNKKKFRACAGRDRVGREFVWGFSLLACPLSATLLYVSGIFQNKNQVYDGIKSKLFGS